MTRRVPKPQAALEAAITERATKPVMGIKRSKIADILRTVPVDYFGEKVTVTYKPDEMSPQKEAELARLKKQAEESENGDGTDASRNAEELALRLSEVMVSWDVLEENDEPSLPTKANLMTFPNALLVHISSAIGEDMSPKAKTSRR